MTILSDDDRHAVLFAHGADEVLSHGGDGEAGPAPEVFRASTKPGAEGPMSALVVGGAGADTLVGTDGLDVLDGGDGDDILEGRGGDDVLIGGTGANILRGGQGFDVAVFSGAYADYMSQFGQVIAQGGSSLLEGIELRRFSDRNELRSGVIAFRELILTPAMLTPGASVLDPGTVFTLAGGITNGSLVISGVIQSVGATFTFAELSSGVVRFANDSLNPAQFDVVITPPSGAPTPLTFTMVAPAQTPGQLIVGDERPNILRGGTSHDQIFGGGGDDLLIGGGGDDDLSGGQGVDVARYAVSSNQLRSTLVFEENTAPYWLLQESSELHLLADRDRVGDHLHGVEFLQLNDGYFTLDLARVTGFGTADITAQGMLGFPGLNGNTLMKTNRTDGGVGGSAYILYEDAGRHDVLTLTAHGGAGGDGGSAPDYPSFIDPTGGTGGAGGAASVAIVGSVVARAGAVAYRVEAVGGTGGYAGAQSLVVPDPGEAAGGVGGEARASLVALQITAAGPVSLAASATGGQGGVPYYGSFGLHQGEGVQGFRPGANGGLASALVGFNVVTGTDLLDDVVTLSATAIGGASLPAFGGHGHSGSATATILQNQISTGGGADRVDLSVTTFIDGRGAAVAQAVISVNVIDLGEGDDTLSISVSGASAAGAVLRINGNSISAGAGEDILRLTLQPGLDLDLTGSAFTGFEQVHIFGADRAATGASAIGQVAYHLLGGASVFAGAAEGEWLIGSSQGERVRGGGGDDRFDAGGGTDMAMFSGVRNDYSVQVGSDGVTTVTDLRNGSPDGADRLTGVELLRFADETVALSGLSTGGAITLTIDLLPYFLDRPRTAFFLTATPTNGVLLNNGEPLSSGGIFTRFDLDAGLVTFRHNEASEAGISFTADNGQGVQETGRLTFLVSAPDVDGTAHADILNAQVGDVVEGRGGDDTLNGSSGAETLNGGAGSDILNGGGGADVLDGGEGDDILSGGVGDDVLTGGSGFDVAVFSGSVADYARSADGRSITDIRGGSPDGFDTLNSIDVLRFSDGAALVTPIAEGGQARITAAMLAYHNAAAEVTFTVTSLTNGALWWDGAPLAVGATFTRTQVKQGLLEFRHDRSDTTNASFTFSVSDGQGHVITDQTFAIGITPLDDGLFVTAGADAIEHRAGEGLTSILPNFSLAQRGIESWEGGRLSVSTDDVSGRLHVTSRQDGTWIEADNPSNVLNVTFGQFFSTAGVEDLVRSIGFRSSNPAAHSATVTITLHHPTRGPVVIPNVTVLTTAADGAPTFTDSGGVLAFTEAEVNQQPRSIDADMTLIDNYVGFGIIRVSGLAADDIVTMRDNAAPSPAQDSYAIVNGRLILTAGSFGTQDLGQVTGGQGADLVITPSRELFSSQVHQILRNLVYSNSSDTPTGTRTLTVSFTDSGGLTASADYTVNVTAENDAPLLTGLATSVQFAENAANGAPQLLDASVTLTDPEANLAGGTLTVSGLLAEDRVSVVHEGTGAGQIGVSGSTVTFGGVTIGAIAGGSGNTLTITLAAGATPAAVQALIQRLGYQTVSDAPTTGRTLSLTVTDGAGGSTGAQTITVGVTAENDAPTTTHGTTSFTYQSGAAPLLAFASATVSDPEGNWNGGLLEVSTVTSQTVLNIQDPAFTNDGDGGLLYNGVHIGTFDAGGQTFLCTFNAAATTAAVQALLRAIGFSSNAQTFGSGVTINLTARLVDGANAQHTLPTYTVLASTPNVAPSFANAAGTLTFGENLVNQTPQVIDADITVSDTTPVVATGVVRVSGLVAGDVVTLADVPGDTAGTTLFQIVGGQLMSGSTVVGAVSGGVGEDFVITLTNFSFGYGPLSRLLNNLTFANTSDTPTASRTLSVSFTDGGGLATSASYTVNVTAENDAPVLNGVATSLQVAENAANGAPQLLDASVTLTDPDGTLAGGTLTVSGLLAEDRVSVVHQGTGAGQIGVDGATVTFGGVTVGAITGGSGNTLTITLAAGATPAAVQALIQRLGYQTTSDTPTASRTLTLTVTDGAGGSTGGQTISLGVTAENDAPVLTGLAASVQVAENAANAAPQLLDASVTLTDPEANLAGGTLTVSGLLAEDRVSVVHEGTGAGQIGVSGSTVTFGGVTVGAITGGSGNTLTITLAAGATPAAVQALIQRLGYQTVSDAPTTGRTLTLTVTDGAGGSTGAQTISLGVTAEDDATTVTADVGSGAENGLITGNVLTNDVDPDGPALIVTAVNGQTASVGTQITLPSGTRLTLNADGSYSYDPNGVFNALPGAASGASNLTGSDSFTYTVSGGATATVTLTVNGQDSTGDVLQGTGGNDTLSAGTGDDFLLGQGGADVLDGGGGADYLDGGEGDDQLTGGAGADLMAGRDGNDVLSGGDDDDTLYGEGGADTLTGGNGSDYLDGGAGADTMDGGAGDDLYVIDDLGDQASEAGGSGLDTVLSSVSVTLGAGLEQLILTGAGAANGVGNGLANYLQGNGAANTLSGGEGDDALLGQGGADVLDGGGGADYLDGGEGDDQLTGGAGADLMAGRDGNDVLSGGDDDDTLYGEGGADTLTGGSGSDYLDGGAGADTINADGSDTIVAGGDADVVNVSLAVRGGSIGLGAGQDTLRPSGFAAGGVTTVVSDFAVGAGGDTLDLATLVAGFTGGQAGVDYFTSGHLRLTQDGADTVLAADSNGGGDGYVNLLRFSNVTVADLLARATGFTGPQNAVTEGGGGKQASAPAPLTQPVVLDDAFVLQDPGAGAPPKAWPGVDAPLVQPVDSSDTPLTWPVETQAAKDSSGPLTQPPATDDDFLVGPLVQPIEPAEELMMDGSTSPGGVAALLEGWLQAGHALPLNPLIIDEQAFAGIAAFADRDTML